VDAIRIEIGVACVEVRAGFDPAALASVLAVLAKSNETRKDAQ
jgi:hypothetical protein